jgi:type II secretory pathway pseudopilin PulG
MLTRRGTTLVARRGITLIEVTVVVTVLSILTVLVLSAVLAAREASRRLSCASNLKQLGLALNNYETMHKVYPQGQNGGIYSGHVMLLPFMEQTNLYHSINFTSAGFLGGFAVGHVNFTAGATLLAAFCCPSDPDTMRNATTNYAWNGGLGDQDLDKDCVGSFCTRATIRFRYIGPSDISDGLSNTAAASEWKLGRIGSTDDSTVVFRVDVSLDEPYAVFVQRCQSATRQTTRFGQWTKNAFWRGGLYGSTILNFNSPPNSLSCFYFYCLFVLEIAQRFLHHTFP